MIKFRHTKTMRNKHPETKGDTMTTAIVNTPQQQQFEDAFSLVRNPADWKAPIRAWVPSSRIAVTLDAVEYYTATRPAITDTHRAGDLLDAERFYLIEADGYRLGPAGDH